MGGANMERYGSLEAASRQPRLVGYYRVLQRAWDELDLSSVLCINHVPTLYRVDSKSVIFRRFQRMRGYWVISRRIER